MDSVELFGFAASVIVAISLMMKNIVKLRIANGIGCAMFSAYGFIIGAMPVALMNGFIMFVNIYYLIKIYQENQAKKANDSASA